MEIIPADYWLILCLITDFAPTTALFQTDVLLLLFVLNSRLCGSFWLNLLFTIHRGWI